MFILFVLLYVLVTYSSGKWSPFGNNKDRIPTTFEVRCNCGHIHNVRTKDPQHTIKCWQPGCETTIRIVLGTGRNNYSIYLKKDNQKEVRTNPVSVIQ